MNPYSKTIIDESSGVEITNDRWNDYQAGMKDVVTVIRKQENPFAFADGKCIPKYEIGFNSYEYCRRDILRKLKECGIE